MDDTPKAPPIEATNYISGVNVVDFGDLRVARGKTRRPFRTCRHKSMAYDPNERRIYCNDCESDVEPFDAFMALVERQDRAIKHFERVKKEAEDARSANLHRIAAKKLEKTWRGKLLPCCPHCSRGITPADMEHHSCVGKTFEMKKREKAAITPRSMSVDELLDEMDAETPGFKDEVNSLKNSPDVQEALAELDGDHKPPLPTASVVYRDYCITHTPSANGEDPRFDWSWHHKNFNQDNIGKNVGDTRFGASANLKEAKREIDEQIEAITPRENVSE